MFIYDRLNLGMDLSMCGNATFILPCNPFLTKQIYIFCKKGKNFAKTIV